VETLQAAARLQEKNTVWTKMATVRVPHNLAQQHAKMIQTASNLAANQDIANSLRIAQAVFLTQDF